MDLVNKLVVFTRVIIFRLRCNVFVKKSPSFQNVDIFPELDRCTPCVFIGTVARFSRNKSLLISFGAPVVRHNDLIQGIKIGDTIIKQCIFADDCTFLFSNRDSLEYLLKDIELFSSLKINLQKSETSETSPGPPPFVGTLKVN